MDAGTKLFILLFLFSFGILLGPLVGAVSFTIGRNWSLRACLVIGAALDLLVVLVLSSKHVKTFLFY